MSLSGWQSVRRAATIGPLTLLLGGCYGAPRTPLSSARSALDRLQEQTSCSRAVQGEASLAFSGEGRRLRGKVMYLAEAPARLRFDVFSPFGVTLSTLTSDGERFSLYNLQERSFLYGPAETCNVQKFTQVPVPAEVLVELLRGRPPVLEHAPEQATIRFRRRFLAGGRYEIELFGANQTHEQITLGLFPEDFDRPPEQQRLRLLGVRVEQAGRGLYEVTLSGHRPAQRASQEPTAEEVAMGVSPLPPSGPACDAEIPGKLKVYVPQTGYELGIDNQEVFHNPPLSAMSFQQNRPSGVSVHRSTCD